uniref:Uncharacterized protein n=1 Tax=Peronospora matthiolae TaxID=2874970 RepID=A0AAV1UDQ3_9STRA
MLKAWLAYGRVNKDVIFFDVCMVARETAPSAVGRESTALNVGNDIFGDTLFSVGVREGTTLNVGNGVVGDTPYSVGVREGTTLNVGNGVDGDTPYSVDGREGTTPVVGNDLIGETPLNLGLGPHNSHTWHFSIHRVKCSSCVTLHQMSVKTKALV